RIQRSADARFAIVVEGHVAIARVWIAPGYRKYGEALAGQIFDQRILRRQIEYVVFHDPCRHDQDWLEPHFFGGRTILDQLDQLVAIDDLAGGRRQGFSDNELFVACRLSRSKHAHPVTVPVLPPEYVIL